MLDMQLNWKYMTDFEIRSNFPWPSSALSNFAKWPFVMDGIQFGGMEGFLQGCKVKNNEHQLRIFRMSGLAAMQAGRAYGGKSNKTLYYQGQPFCRFSRAWQELYQSAYFTCAIQNRGFRDALQSTGTKRLRHSMADEYSKEETILTSAEFCDTLTYIRSLL